MFAVVAYSAPGLRFKERPFLDSITSSTHFVSPAVYGLALAGADVRRPSSSALLVAFFLWGMATHAFGAVQDIVADREGGIGSVATVRGARATVRLAIALPGRRRAAAADDRVAGASRCRARAALRRVAAPFWSVTDADSASANRGWRRLPRLNFVTGFLVTMLLIWWSLISG